MTDEHRKASKRPHVLFVDDSANVSPSGLEGMFEPHAIQSRLRHPEDVLDVDLDWADLVVVDYFLSEWTERDSVESVARAPIDGLAVVATMKSTLLPALSRRSPGFVPDRTVAFALWSSHLKEATFDLPDVVMSHVFSRENNLEWAFRRQDIHTGTGIEQISCLASAVAGLPADWPSQRDGAEKVLFEILGLAESAEDYWRIDAQTDVLECRPPMHELSARSHGLVLLRWMLHRILPYPCFLLDERQLCARLRIDALEGGEWRTAPLAEQLEPYRYAGLLGDFDGPRWWRAGVEDWLFTTTEGKSGSPSAVYQAASAAGAVRRREWMRPVVVINGDLARSDDFAEVEDTVRVRPDDWPVYADDAYALRSLARTDLGLAALVETADRHLIEVDE